MSRWVVSDEVKKAIDQMSAKELALLLAQPAIVPIIAQYARGRVKELATGSKDRFARAKVARREEHASNREQMKG